MSERLSEYLALEAGDYLTQLDRLLAAPGRIDARELLRLARGVRGSAQMAGAQTISGVAERLEDAARSVDTNTIVWTDEVRALAVQTVRDLQILVRAVNRWGPEEERRVRDAVLRWDELEGGEEERIVPIATLLLDDGEGDDPVPIETLQLAGAAALREALALRPAVERAVADGREELVEELFDLIRLGMHETPAEG